MDEYMYVIVTVTVTGEGKGGSPGEVHLSQHVRIACMIILGDFDDLQIH